jgi:hypothetical protein
MSESWHDLPAEERERARGLVESLRTQYSAAATIRVLGFAHNLAMGARYARSDDRWQPRENGNPAPA